MPDTDRAASRQIRILGAISLPHLDGCSPVVSTGHTTQAMGYRPGLVGPGLARNTYTFPIKKVVVRGGRKIKGSSTILGSVAYTNGRLLKLVLYLAAARLLKPSASLHTRRSAVE